MIPRPTGWARLSTVIQSPASRAARRSELPGALGIVRQEPVEQAEGEPARLELGLREQAAGELEVTDGALAPRRRPEAALDGGGQRPAHPVGAPDARCDPLGPGPVVGIGQSAEPPREGRGERVGVADQLGQPRAERLRSRLAFGDQLDGTGGDRRATGGLIAAGEGRHLGPSTVSGVAASDVASRAARARYP